MNEITPIVRYLILCEDVQVDSANPRRITLVGVINAIRSLDDPPYPLLYPELCVFLQLTACHGPGEGCIEIRFADTDRTLFRTLSRVLPFDADPLEVFGVTFRIRNCYFEQPGLYWVQFWYNGAMIAQQALLLR